MNVTNLILYLRSKIGDTSLDQQMLAKAIKLLELGAINTVSSFSSLPSVSTARIDELYLVEFDGLYRTNGVAWIPFTQSFSPTFAWGCNAGDNTTVAKSSPVLVVGGFTDWCQLSAGSAHSLGVRLNGTAWAWGNGGNGQLGDNAAALRSSPVSVVGGFTDWCQVSASDNHSLGVRQNGSAWAWGAGCSGLLGNNNSALNFSSPVSVVGGFTDWCQVSAGSVHSLAVRANGTAWGWGCDINGQLASCGVNRSSPISIPLGFTDWCQVSAGGCHSLGLRCNGILYAWGSNGQGRLGTNSSTSQCSFPTPVVGGFTDWCQASAGFSHSLGLRQNGSAWAWGCNTCGQLGDNTTVSRSSPVSVVGGFTDWCQVSAGGVHSLAIRNEQP